MKYGKTLLYKAALKKRLVISITTLDEQMPGFPCVARIRLPSRKKHEPWFDITILNYMFSLGWL